MLSFNLIFLQCFVDLFSILNVLLDGQNNPSVELSLRLELFYPCFAKYTHITSTIALKFSPREKNNSKYSESLENNKVGIFENTEFLRSFSIGNTASKWQKFMFIETLPVVLD